MRYRVAHYARVLHMTLKGKKREERRIALGRFLNVLRRNRDSSRLGLILAEVEKNYLREKGINKVRIESVSPLAERLRKEITSLYGTHTLVEEVEKPELIAGVKILVDGELLIDASVLRQLTRLFRYRPLAQ